MANFEYVRRKRVISILCVPVIMWSATLNRSAAFAAEISEKLDYTSPPTTSSTTSVTTEPIRTSTTMTASTSTTTTTTSTTTSTTSTTSSTTSTTSTTTAPITTTMVEEPTTSEEIEIEEYEDVAEEAETVYNEEPETDSSVDDTPAQDESVEEIQAEYAPGEYPDGYVFASGYEKGSADYIYLCNTVGHEYGSDFVAIEEKAKVAAVVMNRVNSSLYPNTIYDVLVQKNQFNPSYADPNYHTRVVTYSVKAAVDWYLDIGYADSNYSWMTGYWGDGTWNHFR